MKHTPLSYLGMACLFVLLYACSKTDPPVVTPPVIPPVKNDSVLMDISLVYPVPPALTNGMYEIIMSATGGGVLLDTVAPVNTPVRASFRSDKKLVDVTYIHYFPPYSKFSIMTFKAVDPTGWDSLVVENQYRVPVNTDSFPAGTGFLIYYGVPAYTGIPYFNNNGGQYLNGLSYLPSGFQVEYSRITGNQNYLMLPDQGLYKFSTTDKDRDSVNISAMDQGVRATFARPAGFKPISISLYGVMDESNFNRTIQLFTPLEPIQGAEIAFPVTQVRKYYLTAAFGNTTTSEFFERFSYGDSVTTVLDPPTSADYSLASNSPDNAVINFNRKPGLYRYFWKTPQIDWYYYAPPDSVSQKPRPFMQGLRSKLLGTTDLSTLSIKALNLQRSPQGTTYQQYLDRTLKTSQRNLWPNWASDWYEKQF